MKNGRLPKGEHRKGKCPRCGIDIYANIPWIDGNLCGYKSEDHGCGPEVTLIVFRMPDADVNEIFGGKNENS